MKSKRKIGWVKRSEPTSTVLASDPVGIFCIKFGILDEREEENGPFDPKEQDPFQEDSHERTGGQQTMENDKISLDKHGES